MVPNPTLELVESKVSMGMAEVEVAMEKALRAVDIEVVALLAKDNIPELREKTSLIESPKRAEPAISRFPVVEVEIPTPKPLETVSKEVEA